MICLEDERSVIQFQWQLLLCHATQRKRLYGLPERVKYWWTNDQVRLGIIVSAYDNFAVLDQIYSFREPVQSKRG